VCLCVCVCVCVCVWLSMSKEHVEQLLGRINLSRRVKETERA